MKRAALPVAVVLAVTMAGACDPTGIKGTVTRDDMVWSGKAAWQYVMTVHVGDGHDETFHTSRTTYLHCPVGSRWPACR